MNPPFAVRKIGHAVVFVSDLERSKRFYTEVLGFKISDVYPGTMMPGGMVFLRCNGDHHCLALVGALKPTYEPEPLVDPSGRLVVKGWFPTDPMRVAFSLDFIPSDGEWKLISINVKTVDSPPAAQPSTPKQ